ncbi:DUF934 domain-containing protein [Nisaea acidiphila]|uniref:DUF934 domain-containing protein n=1 Tax=Nisaea acidiphila TaxID=1862145 RepID=A0A9J7AWT6_9PROT|nr:DUF934 domain-containing protein [Nisaea acidiphila]UUX49909.1 DUF934 domain-containing protein [Nisaea acidiphila]
MPIIKNGRIEENVWVPLGEEGDGALDRATPVLVSLGEWKAGKQTLMANFERRAIRLENADAAEEIREDLDAIDAVILFFPKFNDGRAFSQARLLRDRYGFKGEIRATGHVIQDQYLFLQRCGVDAVEVPDENLLDAWNRAHKRFKGYYQPALAVPAGPSEDRPSDGSVGHGGAYSRVEPAVLASWAY